MEEAQLYSRYKGLQTTDAIYVIENYLRLIKWTKQCEEILDVGCGDGQVTIEILLPKLPKNCSRIIGTDKSENMITFARKLYSNTKQTQFVTFDISEDILPVEFQEKFDHIFSFYCLHWVQNQRKAFENIYNMLCPGGDILVTFLASNPIYDIFKNLNKNHKWSPYMQDLYNFISPYHHCNDPEKVLETLLQEIGFVCHVCRVEKRSYTFPTVDHVKRSVQAVTPFLTRLPKCEVDNFIEDYMAELKRVDNVIVESSTSTSTNEKKIHCFYNLFIVFASKPKNI